MPKASHWISQKNRKVWLKEGVGIEPEGMGYAMAEYFRAKVLEIQQRSHLSEENAKARVSRDFVRRVEDGEGYIWQVNRTALAEFVSILNENKQWISATGLKQHGINKKLERLELMLEDYAKSKASVLMDQGAHEDVAKAKVEKEYVREGKNRMGRKTMQLHREKLEDFKDWLKEQEAWLSSSNPKALSANGITTWGASVERILSELHATEINFLVSEGIPRSKAEYQVESTIVRLGHNADGKQVWQIHASSADLLKDRLEFVSTINTTRMADEAGITVSTETMNKVAEELYNLEIKERVNAGMTENEACREVNRKKITYGITVTGKEAWQVHPELMPRMKGLIEEEKQWSSASNLAKHGIGARGPTINLACAYLFDLKVKNLQQKGMSNEEAKENVSSKSIRLTHPSDGRHPIWEVHETALEDLKELLASPEQWMQDALKIAKREARNALNSSSGDPLDALGDRVKSGRNKFSPTWAARVVADGSPGERRR